MKPAQLDVPSTPAAPALVAPQVADDGLSPAHRSWTGLVLSYAVTLFALVNLSFFLPRVMPGDPVDSLLISDSPYVHEEGMREELNEYYGFDQPLAEQYVGYLGDLAQGDLGVSVRFNRPVSELLSDRLPWSLLLVGTATMVATVVGLVAGVHGGWRRGRSADRGLLITFLSLETFPSYLLASFALLVFAANLGWFPLAGAETPFADSMGLLGRVGDVLHHLVLPAGVLAVGLAAGQYLYMRAGMVAELGSDYLTVGRAKGLTERRLKYRYAGRNALLPVVGHTAVLVANVIAGAIFVERVFAYPGLGDAVFQAIGARDYPVLQGAFLVSSALVLTANLAAEVLYRRLDPRTAA